jgi:SHS2 domain-containing protein
MYRWLNHTGEAALAIEAETEEDVFREALAGLRELLVGEGDAAAAGEPLTRCVTLEAADRPALLADWLGELAFLAETEGLVPDRVEAIELEETRLRAHVAGHAGSLSHLVKAVTYHGLTLARAGAGWRATVVLDV